MAERMASARQDLEEIHAAGGGALESTDLRPINVTILHDEAYLSVSLSDSRAVGRFGRIAVPPGLLEQLTQPAAPALQGQACSGTESAAHSNAANQHRKLGSAIFMQLLPEAIRAFLIQSRPRCLYFQLDESLIAIPWELAFDGENFLGEKFRISRQIVSDEETSAPPPARSEREVPKLLLIGGDAKSPLQDRYPESLLARLGVIPGLSAQCVQASKLGRDAALQLIGASDIVHYAGSVSGSASIDGDVDWWKSRASISLREIAALPNRPQLLVSENTGFSGAGPLESAGNYALAKAACRHGLNILALDSTPGDRRLDFMQEIYRELARGSALGEAARQAMTMTRRKAEAENAAFPDVALYGDMRSGPVFSNRPRSAAGRLAASDHHVPRPGRIDQAAREPGCRAIQ